MLTRWLLEEGKSVFSERAAPDGLPVLQEKTTQPRIDGQHQWYLMSLKKEREHKVGWVVRRTGPGELEEG